MRKILILIILSFCANPLFADTIYFNNGLSEKGLIVDEYTDRFVLNTDSGSKNILKKDIKNITYDTQAQNLIQLGKFNESKSDFKNALYYYREAYKLDPSSQAVKDSIERAQGAALQNYSQTSKEAVEEKMLGLEAESMGVEKALGEKDLLKKIQNATGLLFKKSGGFLEIESVRAHSEASRRGINPKDKIVSIWGMSLIYEDFYKALKTLDGPKDSILKINIERTVKLVKQQDIGFILKPEGLFVKNSAIMAIKKDDLVADIKGIDAAYLSVKEAEDLIKDNKNYPIYLKIQRTIYLTRE